MRPNSDLPSNIQELIKNISYTQVIPISEINDIPFMLLKLSDEHDEFLRHQDIAAEFKPSIMNVTVAQETIALCFLQIKLNGSDKYIYSAVFNLSDIKQFQDIYSFLNMQKFGLMIVTNNIHDYKVFNLNFQADFHPRDILIGARDKADSNNLELFNGVAQSIFSSQKDVAALWEYFKKVSPVKESYYVHMQMAKS